MCSAVLPDVTLCAWPLPRLHDPAEDSCMMSLQGPPTEKQHWITQVEPNDLGNLKDSMEHYLQDAAEPDFVEV